MNRIRAQERDHVRRVRERLKDWRGRDPEFWEFVDSMCGDELLHEAAQILAAADIALRAEHDETVLGRLFAKRPELISDSPAMPRLSTYGNRPEGGAR